MPGNANGRTVIVGGGLAGLAAARTLQAGGCDWLLLEAQDRSGGRAASDYIDGFILDRGFQVINTAYESVNSLVEQRPLELRPFLPGARVHGGRVTRTIVDPRRASAAALSMSALGSVGAGDAIRLWKLLQEAARRVGGGSAGADNAPAISELRRRGFSQKMIDWFFRPFFSGVFLEKELNTSWSRLLHQFYYFGKGMACLPRHGIGQIADSMAAGLPASRIRTGCRVTGISPGLVELADGSQIECSSIILATDPKTAPRLASLKGEIEMNAVSCLYFAADTAPFDEPILELPAASEAGPVATVAALTNVQSSYSSDGRALISISALGCPPEKDLRRLVLEQLEGWYGGEVNNWEFLRCYQIPDALPCQLPGSLQVPVAQWDEELRMQHVYLCGDYTGVASFEGAAESGICAAQSVLRG